MSRFAALPIVLAFFVILALGACSRSQPNYGVSAAQLGGDTTRAAGESGPITPGSMREFSARVGDTVYFTTDSTILSSEAQQILMTQSRWLNQYPRYEIVIEGHADERGTREYNIALGARRAASVRRFLITRGVKPERIRTVSYGKERPVAVCANISCWSQNRRSVTVLSKNRTVASY